MSILFYSYNLTREKKFDEIIEKYSIDKFLFLDILFQEVLIIKYFMFFLLNKNLQGIKFIIFLIYSIIPLYIILALSLSIFSRNSK